VLGAVYVLTILYLPDGLMGLAERVRRQRTGSGTTADAKELQSVSH
jgi:hypothetical protein